MRDNMNGINAGAGGKELSDLFYAIAICNQDMNFNIAAESGDDGIALLNTGVDESDFQQSGWCANLHVKHQRWRKCGRLDLTGWLLTVKSGSPGFGCLSISMVLQRVCGFKSGSVKQDARLQRPRTIHDRGSQAKGGQQILWVQFFPVGCADSCVRRFL